MRFYRLLDIATLGLWSQFLLLDGEVEMKIEKAKYFHESNFARKDQINKLLSLSLRNNLLRKNYLVQ